MKVQQDFSVAECILSDLSAVSLGFKLFCWFSCCSHSAVEWHIAKVLFCLWWSQHTSMLMVIMCVLRTGSIPDVPWVTGSFPGILCQVLNHSKFTVLKMRSNFRLTGLPYYHRTAVEEQQWGKAGQTITARLKKSYSFCSCIEAVRDRSIWSLLDQAFSGSLCCFDLNEKWNWHMPWAWCPSP